MISDWFLNKQRWILYVYHTIRVHPTFSASKPYEREAET